MGVFRPGLETPVYDLHVLIKELIDAIGGVSGGIASLLTEMENVNSNLNQISGNGSYTFSNVVDGLASVTAVIESTNTLLTGSAVIGATLPLSVDQV